MKVCSMCKLELQETSQYFATRKYTLSVGFQSVCKECQKEYRKHHYELNRQKYIDKAKVHRDKSVALFKEFKKELVCSNCGEDRHWVLDFHHLDPSKKEIDISRLARAGSKARLQEELNKCIVLCANCHRDLHYQENNK